MLEKTYTRINMNLTTLPSMAITDNELDWFFKAKERSLASQHPTTGVCAILVKRSREIVSRINTNKTHPLQAAWSPAKRFLHAEISLIGTIINERIPLENTSIVIARTKRNGNTIPSYPSFPCRICDAAIRATGIPNIICCDTKGKIVKIQIA